MSDAAEQQKLWRSSARVDSIVDPIASANEADVTAASAPAPSAARRPTTIAEVVPGDVVEIVQDFEPMLIRIGWRYKHGGVNARRYDADRDDVHGDHFVVEDDVRVSAWRTR